jgi:hypothetical protein
LAHSDDSLRHPPKSTPLGAQVALLDGSHSDADPDYITDANVAALREHRPHHNNHNNDRGPPNPQHSRGPPSSRGPPQSRDFAVLEKAIACGFSPCAGCSHPPNICCICDSPHHMSRCCHLLGLPPDLQTRLTAFKQLQDAGNAPFKAQIAAVDAAIAALEASPDVVSAPFDADVQEMAADMRALEDQFHPGYDFPAHSAAVDYYDSLESVVPFQDFTVTAVTSDYLSDLPDLWVPDATDDVSFLPALLPIDILGDGPISRYVSPLSDIVYSSGQPTHVDSNTRNTQDQVPPNIAGLLEENAARELEVINSSKSQ